MAPCVLLDSHTQDAKLLREILQDPKIWPEFLMKLLSLCYKTPFLMNMVYPHIYCSLKLC